MRAGYNDAMPILTERDQAAVRKEFERIAGPVKLVVFSQELAAADLCRQNEQLVREVAALSEQITVEVLNLAIDRARAESYGIDQVPAIVVEGARDYGIRFYGVALVQRDGRAEGRDQRPGAVRGRHPRARLPRRGSPGGGDLLTAGRRSRGDAPPLLFAYGTFMRGYVLHPLLTGGSTFLGEGRV